MKSNISNINVYVCTFLMGGMGGSVFSAERNEELKFQRDLSSFSLAGKRVLNDNETIAIDAKVGLTMLVSAAKDHALRGEGPSALEEKVKNVAKKMKNFFWKLEKFIDGHDPLDGEVFKQMAGLVDSRFGPIASIGSLAETAIPEMPKPFDQKGVEGKSSNESDESYQRRSEAEKQKIDDERRDELRKQLAALKNVVDKSFASAVPAMQRDFRTIQFIAAAIAFLEELKKLGTPQAKELFKFVDYGDFNTENLKIMEELRGGVFFMEFELKPIDDSICEEIENSLMAAGRESGNADEIVKKMKEKLADVRKHGFGDRDAVAGMRGRNTAHKSNNAVFGDRATPIPSPIASRCSDIDLPALEMAKGIKLMKEFLEAMQKGNAFSQKVRMATQTANFQTLPQSRIDLLNAVLNEPILNANALRDQFLKIKFTDKQKTKRTLGDIVKVVDGELKSIPSLGSILKDTGLRTICSVSGTTTDIVAGLVAFGVDVVPALKSLVEYVNAICSKSSTPPQLSKDFKELFLAIAMYMQSGQYHSAGEVLGGLYTSALTLTGDPNVKNFDAIAPKFKTMWEALRDYPEDFFSLELTVHEIIKKLQEQHRKTMPGRHKKGATAAAAVKPQRDDFRKKEGLDALPKRAKDSMNMDRRKQENIRQQRALKKAQAKKE
ncbi:MAG: hypothetical protein LBK24_01375 [Puniceicoccales bacterium]|jgi:hypothetical protein|nr:hypothetical protein [Puniceicoccales bacterium]